MSDNLHPDDSQPSRDCSVMLPHYVYMLVDPANHRPFYIGMGQGLRVNHHWAELKRRVAAGEVLQGAKLERLEQIRRSGAEPLHRVIGRFETRDEAFAVEATLINWVYDFDGDLTNENRGHGSDWIRPHGDLSERPGLDVLRQNGGRDGSFRRQKIENLTRAGAYDFLEDLRMKLEASGFHPGGFEGELRPYDPSEANGYLGLSVQLSGVDFIIGFSSSKRPKITIATTDSTVANAARIARCGWNLGDPKNLKVRGRPRYQDFDPPDAQKHNTIAEVISALSVLRQQLAAAVNAPGDN
jgi:hypothetical protein